MCVIEICSAYAKGAWPSSSRVASCGKGDNCCPLQYASPEWWGFATEEQRNRLDRLLRGLRRCGFLPDDFPSFAALETEAELRQFKSISSRAQALFPAKTTHWYS